MVICIVNFSGDFYDTFLSCMTFHFVKCQALKSENDLLKLAGSSIIPLMTVSLVGTRIIRRRVVLLRCKSSDQVKLDDDGS